MKNIHILSTSKPSRLLYSGNNKNLLFSKEPISFRTFERSPQNIYITNDEEIKEGDWVIANNGLLAKVITELTWHFINSKKIILTTDQELIENGVQAIDDEFLEWFVKNPNCEYVPIIPPLFGHPYIIWIEGLSFKKEPKQETLEEYLQICKDCGSKEVARCKWVNVNTEEIYSADSGTNLEWCFNCKSETNIIDKEDYETRNT